MTPEAPRQAMRQAGPGAGKLQSLEMLRAVAALLVVLYHTQVICQLQSGRVPFGNAFGGGSRGVDLFFVLSGFIIARVHGGDAGWPARLPSYAFNRIARIYPAVWIMTALAAVLYGFGFGGADKAAKLSLPAIAASALLLPQAGDALVNVTWTLKFEMFFYLLFATVLVHRRVGLLVLLLWQAATAVVAVAGADAGLAGYYLRPICLEFGIGLAGAWWLRRATEQVHHPAAWLACLVLSVAGFGWGLAMGAATGGGGVPCAVAAAGIILALVRLEQAGTLRVPALLLLLGDASYAIYIVHFSCLTLLMAALSHAGVPLTDAACLACAACGVAAGIGFSHFVDRPIQRWLRRCKPGLLRVLRVRDGSAVAGAGSRPQLPASATQVNGTSLPVR